MTLVLSVETTMEFINKAEAETRPGGIVVSANKVEFTPQEVLWFVVEQDNTDDPSAFNSNHLSLYIEKDGLVKYERQFCSGDSQSVNVVLEQKLAEYEREAELKRKDLDKYEADAVRTFMRRAASENSRIVSTNDLLDIQIAQARQDGRMLVLQDGLGFVLLPFEISTPKDKSRETSLLRQGDGREIDLEKYRIPMPASSSSSLDSVDLEKLRIDPTKTSSGPVSGKAEIEDMLSRPADEPSLKSQFLDALEKND